MKKTIYSLKIIASIFTCSVSIAQSTLDYRTVTDLRTTPVKTVKNCIIRAFRQHNNDGKFDLAVNEQLGVIGNDYEGAQEIGKAPGQTTGYINVWYPIDGYKRTMIGKHTQHFSMDLYNGDAQDDDWNIRLISPMSSKLIQANKEKLDNLSNKKYPINYINGEIDMKQVSKGDLMKYGLNSPKANIDDIAMYGPWLYDKGWYDGHGTFIEIHPMEQLWWVEKKLNSKKYHLYAFNDNSGRFNERSDFDTDNATLVNTWQTNPMRHTFYVPFEIVKGKVQMEYTISCFSKNNLTTIYTDGIEHSLTYNNQKLLSIKEPDGDILKIEFINVGYDRTAIDAGRIDTVIKGFIKIESSIGKTDGDYAGHLFLNMEEKKKNINIRPILVAPAKWKVKATLTEIKCITADDSNGDEDLMGYIGIRAESDDNYPVQANQLPNNSQTPLLWARLDGYCLNLRQGAREMINESFIYTLSEAEGKIILIADLNEDDGNGDNNKTQMDEPKIGDGDDKLQKYYEENNLFGGQMNDEGVITMPIIVGSLQLNQPITRKMYFGSGGTKIEVSFKIELIAKTDAAIPTRTVDRAQ